MLHIESYRRIVGDYPIAEIYKKARKLYGKNILDINSTYMGGGVAEMKKKLYLKTNEEFSAYTRLGQNQVVIG
jgi:trehalose synthase